jgi:ankyrin repeat protein
MEVNNSTGNHSTAPTVQTAANNVLISPTVTAAPGSTIYTPTVDISEAETDTSNLSSVVEALPLHSITGSAQTSAHSLLSLPNELLTDMMGMFDSFNDERALAQTCNKMYELYKLSVFEHHCSKLIKCNALDTVEKKQLQDYYHFILSRLFNEDMSEETLKAFTHLVEKFFKHFSKKDIQETLFKVLENVSAVKSEGDIYLIFEKLAVSNLPFTINLITALNEENFKQYSSCILTQLSDIQEVLDFLTIMREEMNDNSVLHYALRENRFDIVFALLKATPQSVNVINANGISLLMEACNVSYDFASLAPARALEAPEAAGGEEDEATEIVEDLEGEASEDIEVENLQSLPIEKLKSLYTLKKLIDILIKSKNFDINVKEKAFGWTVLIQAIAEDQYDIVHKLFERKDLNVNLQDESGNTALIYALNRLQPAIVQALLARNINIHLQNMEERDALMESVLAEGEVNTCLLLVEALLNKGANVHLQDQQGLTALMHAVIHGHWEITKLLLQRKADINLQDSTKKTALMHAISNDKYLVAILLLKQEGIDMHLADEDGRTALEYIIALKRYSLAAWIINHQASLNVREQELSDAAGITPLMHAIIDGSFTQVELLLNSRLNINLQDTQGKTALMYAVSKGYADMVRLLLENGAERTLIDRDGRSALQIAIERGNQNIINLLKRSH